MQQPAQKHLDFNIPVDGIHVDTVTGFDTALIDGRPMEVLFDFDLNAWRAVIEDGGLSGPLQGLARESRTRVVTLPAFPAVPENTSDIPRFLHFVWVGHTSMPESLAQRVVLNALRTPGFRTIVHADMATPALLSMLRERFRQVPWITVISLRTEPSFEGFASHPVYPHYEAFMCEATRNYGAASDLLRLWLVYAYGGIYMDVDDEFVNEVPIEACLKASADDLLLGSCYSVVEFDVFSYTQSHFASQPRNALLMQMLAESANRLATSPIFSWRRPWRTPGEPITLELNTYIREVLRITGPKLFTDVIAENRTEAFNLEGSLLRAMEVLHYTPDRPRYLAGSYLAAAGAALAHYQPFGAAGPFQVKVGAEGSWNVA